MKKRLFLVVAHQPDQIDKLQALLGPSFPEAELITAASDEEGLAIAQSSYPDVIFMELTSTSPELCRWVKVDAMLKTVPVVFTVLPQTSSALKREALNSGGDGFLNEAYDEIELMALIRSMLKIRDIGYHQERYRIMIESLPNTIGITDESGMVKYRSPNNELLFARKAEETIGRNGFDLIHPQDRNRIREKLHEVVAGGYGCARSDHFRFLRADGGETFVGLTGKNFIENPFINGILISYNDITKYKKIELELARSEEQYRRAQKMGQIGHWLYDPLTDRFEGSEEALRIYGFEGKTEVRYDEIISCLSKKDIERNKDALLHLLKNDIPFDEELEIWPQHERSPRYIWATAQRQLRENGQDYLVSGILQDITERKQLEKVLQKQHRHLEVSNRMLSQRLEQSINAISKIGELRDLYTAGHQRKVADLSCAIAREMGLSEDAVHNLYMGALIHDIGKLYIASDILNKPGKITNLEYQILQTHVESGYAVVKEIDFIAQIPKMIYQHHERLDGSGYPQGLRGNAIILESRILAVADVVEAMSSHRPYRPALGIEVALNEITAHQGEKYDPDVVAVCVTLFHEKGYQFAS